MKSSVSARLISSRLIGVLLLGASLVSHADPSRAQELCQREEERISLFGPLSFPPYSAAPARSQAVKGRTLLAVLASQKEPWEDYWRKILHQLAGDDVTASLGVIPVLSIHTAPRPNAYSISPNKVVVSSALLDLVETSSEFAFVLAHELAHVVLHHASHESTDGPEPMIRREIEADAYAMKLLREGGFDPSAGLSVLSKLREFGRENGALLEHSYPSLSVRFKALDRRISEDSEAVG